MTYHVQGHPGDGTVISEEIPSNRYDEICRSKLICVKALAIEEIFALLLDNYLDFEAELLRRGQELVIWSAKPHDDTMIARLDIDRRILNFFTSCRLYLDSSCKNVSAIYGDPSTELASLKLALSSHYDECWGYRFMEGLRNYVQHQGLPTHVISQEWSNTEGQNTRYGQYSVVPQVSLSILRYSKIIKKSILDELGPDKHTLDLRRPTREYVMRLASVHYHIRATLDHRLKLDRQLYQNACNDYSRINDHDVVSCQIYARDSEGTSYAHVDLDQQFLSYYDRLFAKNSINPELAVSSVNNTLKDDA